MLVVVPLPLKSSPRGCDEASFRCDVICFRLKDSLRRAPRSGAGGAAGMARDALDRMRTHGRFSAALVSCVETLMSSAANHAT
jgi:hypothetical protein